MGRNHARILTGLEGVDLVGVVDPAGRPDRVPHGVPLLESVAELVEVGIDYAVVACPTALHGEVGLALAEAARARSSKALAESVEAAERLVTAFESRGLVAGVGHIERFNPALQSMRTRLEAGNSARCSRSSPAARAPSRTGSPTSAWSRTSPPTTST